MHAPNAVGSGGVTTDEVGNQGWSQSGASTGASTSDSQEEKPVKVGQELDVEITEMSRRGDGVARIQGFVVFVPRATHGQKVKIRVVSMRPNFAVAEIRRATGLGPPPVEGEKVNSSLVITDDGDYELFPHGGRQSSQPSPCRSR